MSAFPHDAVRRVRLRVVTMFFRRCGEEFAQCAPSSGDQRDLRMALAIT